MSADAGKGSYDGPVGALFAEEPPWPHRPGACVLKEAKEYSKKNCASTILTAAGYRCVGLFKKNGYLLRGELKDVPKGHNCCELYKTI